MNGPPPSAVRRKPLGNVPMQTTRTSVPPTTGPAWTTGSSTDAWTTPSRAHNRKFEPGSFAASHANASWLEEDPYAAGPTNGVNDTWSAHDAVLRAQGEEYRVYTLISGCLGSRAQQDYHVPAVDLDGAQRTLARQEPRGSLPETNEDLGRRLGHWAAKILISAIWMLEKHQLLPRFTHEGHWLQVQALGWMSRGEGLPRIWATADDLRMLVEHRVHSAWGRTVFFVVAAITLCMRVSDVVSIWLGWLSHPDWLVFLDTKVNKELVAMPISVYLEARRWYLCRHRRPHHRDDSLLLLGGTASARSIPAVFFKGTESPLHC